VTKAFGTAVALGILAASFPAQIASQVVGQEPGVLRSVTAVDAQVAVTWVDAITKDGGPTETQYEQAFLSEFRAGLQRGGLQISETAPNYLFCTIALLYEENGLVSAAQAVEYHEMLGPDQQWAITWTLMQVFTVGFDHFSGQDDAQWCSTAFVDDWKEGNSD
jgi:hypothetical protein